MTIIAAKDHQHHLPTNIAYSLARQKGCGTLHLQIANGPSGSLLKVNESSFFPSSPAYPLAFRIFKLTARSSDEALDDICNLFTNLSCEDFVEVLHARPMHEILVVGHRKCIARTNPVW